MNQNINIKIMKKPELTDEEIRSHMHFDKLLEAYKVTGPVSSGIKWNYFVGYSVSAVLVILTALYFLLPESKKTNERNSQQASTSVSDSSVHSKKQEVIQVKPKTEIQEKTTLVVQPKTEIKNEQQPPPVEQKKITPSQFTEAEPIAGYSSLYEYFDQQLKYPIEAVRDSIAGIVTVSFVITEEGKPAQIKIENSLGAAFDKECERVIMAMPLWKPATINHKPIATRLSIPLTFKIKK